MRLVRVVIRSTHEFLRTRHGIDLATPLSAALSKISLRAIAAGSNEALRQGMGIDLTTAAAIGRLNAKKAVSAAALVRQLRFTQPAFEAFSGAFTRDKP